VIDLAFVLHSADTVHPERWQHITQFVVDAVKRLDVGTNRTRIAIITWSDTAHVAFTLDQFTSRQDVTQVLYKRYFTAKCPFAVKNEVQENSSLTFTIVALVKVSLGSCEF